MAYKAVIFDLDGTLLDTLEDLADAMNRTLEERGFPSHPVAAYRYFVGNGSAKLVSRALPPEKRNEALVADCMKEFLKEYDRNWNRKTRPYDGVAELLDTLTLKQIQMAIFTNKLHGFAERCVQEFLSRWKFEAVFGQRDGYPLKPDPAVPREIAGILDVSPEQFLYLGDSDADMKTAVNAGMLPVGALWGFRSAEELRDAGAAELIGHPTDLLAFVN
ncbi:putative phosphoglycolate phosphatase, bacterial [delta proteobacterium NaphS2]|nr:putative phosphoglycolate phosphatase, bacterial [delta proteobacterium NaphS2]